MAEQNRSAPEEIVKMLREADVRLSHGERVGPICKRFGISVQSYYRWRRQYGGLRLDQMRRLKSLELENARLRRIVAGITLSPSHPGSALI